MGHMVDRKHRDFTEEDIQKLADTFEAFQEQEDDGEPFEEKMTRLTSELSDMFERSHELENEIRRKLGAIGYEI